MDKANTIGMFISTSLMAAILGAISGLVWAFALSCPLKSGLFYGGIIGLIVGLLFFLFQKAATSSGNLQNKEVSFASGSMMTMIFMISTVIAIVVGLVRWLFF
ncbi:MAG: hypothetical protein KKG99_03795 [Bacteroidetes bacterium]|nr:hypothetical protein [Bacteroidota bacterium]